MEPFYYVQCTPLNQIIGLYANAQPQPDGTSLTLPTPLFPTDPAIQAYFSNPRSLPVVQIASASVEQMPTPFNSDAEHFGDIAISSDAFAPPMYSIYSCQIDAAQPTDQYRLDVQCEITNPNSFAVGIGAALIRTSGGVLSVLGVNLIPATMENITPDEHHKVFVRNAWDSGISGTVWYNFVIWPASTQANGGQNIHVEQGYGKLVVARFR